MMYKIIDNQNNKSSYTKVPRIFSSVFLSKKISIDLQMLYNPFINKHIHRQIYVQINIDTFRSDVKGKIDKCLQAIIVEPMVYTII
jgi:hypothetical protein